MKKLISLLSVLAMVVCLFAACGGTDVDPSGSTPDNTNPSETVTGGEDTVQITDGYYFMAIEGGRDCFVHFSADGTYYGSYFGGSIVDAGVWELVDEAVEYYVDADKDGIAGEEDTKATAVQAVKMTSYATGEPVLVAYADDTLHNFNMNVATRTLYHDVEYVYNVDNETPIQIFVFYANNDIGATFILNHNKTFDDATGDTFENGTWEMTGAGEYALKYDFDGSSATLKVEGTCATLTHGDAVVELKDTYEEEVVRNLVMSLTNSEFSVQGLAATLILNGYDDGCCELIVDMGNYGSKVIDQGTYEVSAAMKPTLTFDAAGVIEGTPDYATAGANGITITVHYSATTSLGAVEADLVGLYNPTGVGGTEEPAPVEAKGTLSKGDGIYTCEIEVSGHNLGVEIRIAQFAESGEVIIACGGGEMTCQYTAADGQVTLTGGDDATGYLVHFKDAILGTWNIG